LPADDKERQAYLVAYDFGTITMFDIIRKQEYFDLLGEGFADQKDHTLKGIQDGWIWKQLADARGKKILEVGGGNSRILPRLKGNDLWNVEKFEGVGNGPTAPQNLDGVQIVPAFMGEFNPDLPQVDILFSISVVEHIPFNLYASAFEDMARCLKPGGSMYHAVDLPLGDEPLGVAQQRIQLLLDAAKDNNLLWREPPAIGPDLSFSCNMATNSDLTMWNWTRISEPVRITGPELQITTIKMIATRPE
jgi:SAM-dependent methyltransferase